MPSKSGMPFYIAAIFDKAMKAGHGDDSDKAMGAGHYDDFDIDVRAEHNDILISAG